MVSILCGIAYHISRAATMPHALHINQTTTLPITNQTVLQHEFAQSWVGDSPVRSTWEILYSCLAALITCFSSFVQLNPPAYHERWRDVFFRKAKWVVVTILIPEVVVLNAWLQWKRAVALHRSLLPLYAYYRVMYLITIGRAIVDHESCRIRDRKGFPMIQVSYTVPSW
jgi:hypothetical protein